MLERSENVASRTHSFADSGHRRSLQARHRLAGFADVRLKLGVSGSPRVDNERVARSGLGSASEVLEDAPALHRPEDVVEAIAASRRSGPATLESLSRLTVAASGH